ncbi:tetratricopeptide repeat protein [Spirosoma pulveris]
MNTDLETIENYVTGQLTPDERTRFEAALRTDPDVAEALAFYMLSKHVANEQAREQRKAELNALRKPASFWSVPMRWAAAASIAVLLGLGWYFLRPANSPEMATRLADDYVAEHFMQLPTTMDGESSRSTTADSLKTAVGLVNSGKLNEAEALVQDILKRQPTNDRALKYAGIVALRLGNYDQAISLFHRLSERTDLYSNPGLFYESLALLKRGRPMDKEQAKKLLDEVITRNLDGKVEAEKLIKSF